MSKSKMTKAECPELTGVEPARPCEHQPLKLARLPIPPPGQAALLKSVANIHYL
jgi:hypothetical protein